MHRQVPIRITDSSGDQVSCSVRFIVLTRLVHRHQSCKTERLLDGFRPSRSPRETAIGGTGESSSMLKHFKDFRVMRFDQRLEYESEASPH